MDGIRFKKFFSSFQQDFLHELQATQTCDRKSNF